MRSYTTIAILASSLLVGDVAARFDVRKRDMYLVQENIVVTELITVTAEKDGSYATGTPVAVGTGTSAAAPVLMSNVPAAVISSAPVQQNTQTTVQVTTSAASSAAQVVAPVASSSPAITTYPPVILPTTLATVINVPKPVTTSAKPATTTTAAVSKKGLAYNDASLLSGFTSAASWAYNWGTSGSGVPSGVEYVPMLWGLGSHTNGWTAAATSAIASGSTHLLGFNEPDLGAQSNLSPADAAAGWKTYMQPFAGKAKLGSPAVTNGGSPMGLTWTKNFISACTDCTIDFVAVHWYNGGDASAFKTYMTNAYAAGGNRPLWITEFEAPGSDTEQIAFLAEVLPWLDSQSFVERYAYFGVFSGNLISTGDTLSSLGEAYIS